MMPQRMVQVRPAEYCKKCKVKLYITRVDRRKFCIGCREYKDESRWKVKRHIKKQPKGCL
jgi:hypothetical protein